MVGITVAVLIMITLQTLMLQKKC